MGGDHKTHYNLSDGDKEHELNTKLTAAADFQGPIKVRTDWMTGTESDGRGHEAGAPERPSNQISELRMSVYRSASARTRCTCYCCWRRGAS